MCSSNVQAVISDTVGFIQKLPPQLVAAFQATLDDIKSASLILHVVDCSHPLAAAQSDAVMKVRELALHRLCGQTEHVKTAVRTYSDACVCM